MAIIGRIDIGGTTYYDSDSIEVMANIGEDNSVANFSATFPNYNGLHTSDFTIGDTVAIYSGGTKIFNGSIEDINFSGKPNNEKIVLSGRDATSTLVNTTIEPVVYRNSEVSTIVTSIISNADGITTNNVNVTTTTIGYIAYNHTNVYDALKQLSELSGFYFYVDTDNDLHFEEKGNTSSGYTFDNTNVLKSSFRQTDKEMANRVWVYGDRILTRAPIQWFTSTGGSEYTLAYKPHNTKITYAGSIKKGGVFNILKEQASGVDYLVDYDLKKVIFISGTIPGNHIVPSGGSFSAEYDRSAPVIKYAQDNTSINTYGKKDKVIVNKEIKEPQLAREVALRELDENANPKIEGNLDIEGVAYLVPGNTCIVNLPYENITNQTYDILQVKYSFTQKKSQLEQTLKIKVSKKLKNVVDTLKQLINDIKKMQAQDAIDTEFISRLETSSNEVTNQVKQYVIRTREIGSSFIIGHSINGILGSSAGVQPILGSGTVGSYVNNIVFNLDNEFDHYFNNNTFTNSEFTTATLNTVSGAVYF